MSKPLTEQPIGQVAPEWAAHLEAAKAKGICPQCHEPARPKCHTEAAIRELDITGICGECWDDLFADDE